MSLSSTGSFGRVSATTIGGHSPIVIDGETTFVNSITSSAHVSSSMTSTASFGRVNVLVVRWSSVINHRSNNNFHKCYYC